MTGDLVYNSSPASVGIVETGEFTFAEDNPIELESGATLGPITLVYETYGRLNQTKSNAILIQHALTGNHHAAGKYSESDKHPGWWDLMIGPGKSFDTNKFFVICTNCLGGCSGTTGPNSINPKTGKPYGLSFPIITIGDMVKVQTYLMDHFQISMWHCVAGGSMGGMLAIHWAVHYPEKVKSVISIASTSAQSAQSIAFSEVGRQSIIKDPNWNKGQYINDGPRSGLSISRMMAHITYLSDESMRNKFGRRLEGKEKPQFTFDAEFQVESYLRYQGDRFIDRFDANSYLYITKALNYFDLESDFGTLKKAFDHTRAKFLVIAFSSDWLYPPYMSKTLVQALVQAGKEASYIEIESSHGHDAFLIEAEKMTISCKSFLKNIK